MADPLRRDVVGTYCTMQLGSLEKVIGIQVRTDGTTFLSVGDSGWSFTPRSQMTVKIAIDGAAA